MELREDISYWLLVDFALPFIIKHQSMIFGEGNKAMDEKGDFEELKVELNTTRKTHV